MSFPSLSRLYSGKWSETSTNNDVQPVKKILKVKKLVPTAEKPANYDKWERKFDESGKIYYQNGETNESTWLMPCVICYRTGDRWCVDCKEPYCEKHFIKKHMPLEEDDHQAAEEAGLTNHSWSLCEEGFQEPLLSNNDEHCIYCNVKVATKLCNECWDPYCNTCFSLSHRVGTLLTHKGLNYKRAKMAWYCKRGAIPVSMANSAAPMPQDRYINGATGQVTPMKPAELMSDLERVLLENLKSHRFTVNQQSETIEKLQREMDKANRENNKTLVDLAKLNQVMRKKEAEEEKAREGEDVAAAMVKKGGNAYRTLLMNPSSRRRGQARSNYIKSILEAPFPNTPEAKQLEEELALHDLNNKHNKNPLK